MQRYALPCALVVMACFALGSAHAGYSKSLVIDWGNEWTKVVVMNPQAKSALSRLEMAVNEQSNRKTPSVVGLTGDGDETERVLGEDAAGLLYRSPSDAYGYLKRLLGQFRDSAAVTSFLADFPAGTHTLAAAADSDARRTVRFARGASSSVSVEQMVVSVLQWCKRLGEQHVLAASGETTTIADAVLLVPEHWTSAQRTLYTQLATLAGLNVKAVLNELTAVALDYGNRNFADAAAAATRKVVFYNVGAQGTAAALVQFTKLDGKDGGFRAAVLASAYDADVGGLDFDLAVREHLIAEFDAKHKKAGIASIRTSKKAMAKLLREARDLKEQLSAGSVGTVQVEEIFEGKDFAVTLTRDKFEELTRALVTRALAPLKDLASRDAALLADISALELYGGGVRIPALQTALLADYAKAWGGGALGKHIDGDEAGVFGAGLYAAVIGGIPGTKKVEVDDKFVNANGASASELSASDIATLREALERFDSLASLRAARQEARNKFESFVVELKDKLEVLSKKLTEEETDALAGLVSEAQDWADYETTKSTAATEYAAKLDALRDATAPLLKAATAKHEKDQAAAKVREAADEKKRERELKGKARERAQDKAYARAQAAKEQQKTKAKAAKASGKANAKPNAKADAKPNAKAKDTKPAAGKKAAGKKSGDKTEL